MCPSEFGRHSSDQSGEASELRGAPEMTHAQREAYAKNVMDALAQDRTAERERSIAAAAERGISKEQWEEYQRLGEEDSWQGGRIEGSRYRLREGPPNYEGTRPLSDTEKREYVDKYRTQENEAIEHFRTDPAEGADNRSIDPERVRPWVHCRAGDPPIEPGDLTRHDRLVYTLSDGKGAGHPHSGLARPEATPHPSHSAEERAEKITEGRARAAEVVGKQNWSNAKYAGEVFCEKLDDDLKVRYPDGVEFTYEGFPIFDRYAVKTVRFDDGFAPLKADGKPDRSADNKRANAIFGWKFDPPGMTWHHKEDSRTMLLVDKELHGWVRHWGGISIGKRREEGNADA